MTIADDEKALCDVQRLTTLARATDDGILRADYYRLAQKSRDDWALASSQTVGGTDHKAMLSGVHIAV